MTRIHFSTASMACWFAALTLLAAPVVAQAQAPAPGPCEAQLRRWRELATLRISEWRAREWGDFRGEATDLQDASWEVVKAGKRWPSGGVWLRTTVEVPAARDGYALRGARLELETSVYVHWQTRDMPVFRTVFVNGLQRASGYEFEPVVLTDAAQPGEKFVIALRAQTSAGTLILGDARVRVTRVAARPDAQVHLEELTSAELLHRAAREEPAERAQIIAGACATVDWSALERGDQAAFDRSLESARMPLERLRPWLKSYQVVAAGNAHIDMAWLWPWTETVEVTRNTFASALTLMQEFPDFKFSHGSVATYFWMEDKYPELFRAIQQRAREGRWEFVGGMWVEPDLNMPDGESLARQLLVGKRYMKEKFGAEVRIGYNPDSFGYNWQLPQIYKKSGIDYFVTQKMAWNDTSKHPHKLFWWESPDGSRVLTFFPHDYVNSLDPVRIARDQADYARQTGVPRLLHLYGIGDHGGGPTRHMLETGRHWQRSGALFPALRLGTMQEFFDGLAPLLPAANVPVWKGELYFQYHRGVQTTQAATKKNNRFNEVRLLNAEKLATLAWLGGREYPRGEFETYWRKLLFNQFHDILPGSGIDVVYRDAARDHAEVRRFAEDEQRNALDALASRMNTSGAGIPIVVFNPVGWRRSALVEVDLPVRGPGVRVEGPEKQVGQAEILEGPSGKSGMRIRFRAENLPGLGVAVYRAVVLPQELLPAAGAMRAGDGALDNEFVRVVVDAKTGCMTSLFDKRSKKEALAPGGCGNLLQAFRDKPRDWDAWNIDADFEKERWDITGAEEVKLVESGPLRGVLRVRRKWRASTFEQNITVTAGSPRVDVHMTVDWREEHTLLKVAFPVHAKSAQATFEIPYGTIQRPTTRRTPEEQAQFEVPALRWADLSDASGGLSLLNDSKYGYDAKDNVLRLTLLRSPKWPDPAADRGRHEFTYALLPHAGGWREAQTVRHGYELNYPVRALVTHKHAGVWGQQRWFVRLASDNVVLTAFKKAEDSEEVILRFYEFAGTGGDVRIELADPVAQAWEANLQEARERELHVHGSAVVVPTRPYEIKTVKLRLAAK